MTSSLSRIRACGWRSASRFAHWVPNLGAQLLRHPRDSAPPPLLHSAVRDENSAEIMSKRKAEPVAGGDESDDDEGGAGGVSDAFWAQVNAAMTHTLPNAASWHLVALGGLCFRRNPTTSVSLSGPNVPEEQNCRQVGGGARRRFRCRVSEPREPVSGCPLKNSLRWPS